MLFLGSLNAVRHGNSYLVSCTSEINLVHLNSISNYLGMNFQTQLLVILKPVNSRVVFADSDLYKFIF